MFNLIVTSNPTAWETDQIMRFRKERFGEDSGVEAKEIKQTFPDRLRELERWPTFLMYEECSEAVNRNLIRYGKLNNITVAGTEITFRFQQEGTFRRSVMKEFGDRLGIGEYEWNRTHWAVKDGGIPSAMVRRLEISTDIVHQDVTLFISHASEDKDAFVRPLAEALRAVGFNVWYDEYVLKMGDSLREKIDLGLKNCDYGVVVLSKNFFEKNWAQKELDGLYALETANKKLILPVWLGVNEDDVAQYSPTLAGRYGVKGEKGVTPTVEEIQISVSASRRTREFTVDPGLAAVEKLNKKLLSRDAERKRLQSAEGSEDVIRSANIIADEIAKVFEPGDRESKKLHSITRQSRKDYLSISGPNLIRIDTALRDAHTNTADNATFYVRIGQGDYEMPHPSRVKTLEEIVFLPRIVDGHEIKWQEVDGDGVIRSSKEAATRIIERYVHHIDESTN